MTKVDERATGAAVVRGSTIRAMDGYVDIHSHVLPGIDDGAPTMDEALAMLRTAAASGTTTIAATPHLGAGFPQVDVHELAGRCDELSREAAKGGVGVRLVSGAEVSLAWALDATRDERALATYGQQGRDLLIETPSATVAGLDALLYQLRAVGLRITLAHPERSGEFQRQPDRLAALAQQGVLLQIDAASLLAHPRRSPASALAWQLCATGLVHAIASDAHRAGTWRPVTRLSDAADAAAARFGPDRAAWLAATAPAAIIAGAELPDPPPIERPRKRRWQRRRA